MNERDANSPAITASDTDDVLVVGRETNVGDVSRVTEVALVFGLRERGIRYQLQLTYY